MSVPATQIAPPLSLEQRERLQQALLGLDAPALYWASGFAAGLAAARGEATAPATESRPGSRLTVLYGSQTGNARRIAEALAAKAEAQGLAVRLLRADRYPLRELAQERLLAVVISTQGEGEPPEDALAFCEFLHGKRAPRLESTQFAVLALGDSSYPQFCAVGRALDARLHELGGKRVLPLAEADLDIDTVASPWEGSVLARAGEWLGQGGATVTPLRRPGARATSATHDRAHPFAAEVLVNQRLTGRAGSRAVHHLELDLAGSGLSYQPGDALGVWARNDPALIARVLDTLALDPTTPVKHGEHELTLAEWLRERRELTRLSLTLLRAQAERSGADELRALLADAEATRAFLGRHQLLDVLRRWPAAWDAQALVAALPPLSPRLYSIASSSAEVGYEAHLTVALQDDGEGRVGLASGHLLGLAEGARASVYIEANDRFRLPADGARDLIMIGAGTGIAPYRGFLQQRRADGARGRHWLAFGARTLRDDFLYQLEWQRALREGQLARIDLAFSRGPAGRVLVQDKLRAAGAELWRWLDDGAHLYVCGGTAMAAGVEQALLATAQTHGGLDAEAGKQWLRDLQQQGRYARDIY